ncbi:hypothetical protein [Metabacillus fastidiosus]|uniref:hypothetical protein n=1 Tax=Metabacillus fastidiosus TaxID=1458 RepID=UPI002DBB81A2|nr:hypothetical protein [Metabacillus fastidiosus]MEC2076118.1 hypothetical protein [Metabacillus fastidiosus]
MSSVDEKEGYYGFGFSFLFKLAIFTGLLGVIALYTKDFFELPWLELVAYACFAIAGLSVLIKIMLSVYGLIEELPWLIKGAILFTFIGLASLVASGILVFDVLEYIYIGSFSLTGLLLVLELVYWTFGKVSGLSFLIRVIVFSAIVGTVILVFANIFAIQELKTAYLIVYGIGIISLICELFKIIFLKD